jgi:O-antigen/teichoic acid export membrane protein
VPVGVGGTLFAAPIVHALFGPVFAGAAPVLRILAWSAVLVILRGTYRHGLNAAGRADLDLVCAGLAAAANVGANLVLIPRLGLTGAALATVLGEAVWLAGAWACFRRVVGGLPLGRALLSSGLAALLMGAVSVLTDGLLWWPLRAGLGLVAYGGALLALGAMRPSRSR